MNRAILCILLAACAKEPSPSPSPSPSKPSSPAGPTVAAPAPHAAMTDAPARTVLPSDLPAFGSTAASDPKKAAELAHQAIRATLDGDTPMADAIAAVTADPGSAYARYAIACVANDEAFATTQLEAVITAGCADCADVVRNVLLDSDCPWTDAHKALVAKAKPSAQRDAVETIAKALLGPDRRAAKPFFTGPRVTSRFACSNCSDTTNDRRFAGTGSKVQEDLTAMLAKNDGYQIPLVVDRMLRKQDCFVADRLLLHHNHVFLDKICFAPGTTQVTSIDMIDG